MPAKNKLRNFYFSGKIEALEIHHSERETPMNLSSQLAALAARPKEELEKKLVQRRNKDGAKKFSKRLGYEWKWNKEESSL